MPEPLVIPISYFEPVTDFEVPKLALWLGKALDQFDDSWWIANSRQASGNLYFTYELV